MVTASSASRLCPPLATMTGSSTSGTPGACSASTSATSATVAASASIPVFTASAPISSSMHVIWSRRNAPETGWMSWTPIVFCAVSAVMAVAA